MQQQHSQQTTAAALSLRNKSTLIKLEATKRVKLRARDKAEIQAKAQRNETRAPTENQTNAKVVFSNAGLSALNL